MKKRNLISFLVLCICMTGILFLQDTGAQAATISRAELKKIVIHAYQNYETEINVKSYGLYDDEAGSNMLSSVMEEVINETPYLFYTGREFSKAVMDSNHQIIRLNLTYSSLYIKNGKVNKAKIRNDRKRIDAAAKKVLSNVNSKMSDVEKAMVIHDYLVRTVTYNDKRDRESRLSEVGTLLEHRANCQGYSVTYRMLLNKAGISSKCVSSQKMRHMWNLVKIGADWYHVDVTWDDPLNAGNYKEQYGVVLHDNFLLSDKKIKKNNHYGFGKTSAASTKYDNAYWRKVNSAFWYRSGKFVYADLSGIYMRSSLIGGRVNCLKRIAARCLVKYSANKYYLIAKNQIYLFQSKKGTLRSVYKAPYGSRLTELKYSAGKLNFRYRKMNKIYTNTRKVKSNGLLVS